MFIYGYVFLRLQESIPGGFCELYFGDVGYFFQDCSGVLIVENFG